MVTRFSQNEILDKMRDNENESCDLFSSKSLDVSQVIGNTPLSGPMQRTVETDALRLHWECSSGCGLICGGSLGKQFQNLAVYWK